MVIVTCLYIAVGFFGYLKYGEDVLGSITLNLPVDQWSVHSFSPNFWTAPGRTWVPPGEG
jgi:amino acid permease